MKYKLLLTGIVLSASSAFASAAAINTTNALSFVSTDGTLNSAFGHTFGSSDAGKSFLDEFTFTIAASQIGATFSSPFTNVSDLTFSAFELYSSTGTVLATGKLANLDQFDFGKVASVLGAGSYKLDIAGSVAGSSGGMYTGSLSVSPVPEPATWGMTLSGLAAVGFLARRRKATGAKPA